jgi:hypothetical protein
MVDDIQLGGIGRKIVDMNLLAREGLEESRRFLVPTEPAPNHQSGPLKMAAQLLHKRKEIFPGEVLWTHGEIKTQAFLPG